jgi:RNA polymerase sigma factor (sigma-70 family)
MIVHEMERQRAIRGVSDDDTVVAVELDVTSFDDFYRAHRDRMARALSLTLRDPELGADAADEAFARACQRWNVVRDYRNPEGWVYRVAMNWARSWMRRKRRERDRQPLVATPDHSFDQDMDVDLGRAISTLSDDHRAVVVSRFFLDWSVGETAVALKIAEGTVKSRLSRALMLLEQELAEASVANGSDAGIV